MIGFFEPPPSSQGIELSSKGSWKMSQTTKRQFLLVSTNLEFFLSQQKFRKILLVNTI